MHRSSRPGRSRWTGRLAEHHLPLAAATLTAVILLFVTRPYHDWVSRLSFATAYPALLLLALTLCIGPWSVLRGRRNPISSDLRRDIGIWAGLTGVVHSIVGQCVHLRGRPWLYYFYEHGRGHGMPVRHDLFGFSNFTGLFAGILLLALLATSNDFSLRRLGTPRWKRLQRLNYFCFGLAAVHTILYQISEKKMNLFIPAAAAGIGLTMALQLYGFGILRRKRGREMA